MSENDWKNRAKGLLKSEIARRNLSYIEISKKLESIGVYETPKNISNKIARGSFGAVFMLQVFEAIGCDEIRLI